MLEALCRSSSTTLDIVHTEDGPPITQRTSGLDDSCPCCLRASCCASNVCPTLLMNSAVTPVPAYRVPKKVAGPSSDRLRLVFDQSILASLGDPIIDQLAAYRARDHEAASYEPV
jgi:hypothetical protein